MKSAENLPISLDSSHFGMQRKRRKSTGKSAENLQISLDFIWIWTKFWTTEKVQENLKKICRFLWISSGFEPNSGLQKKYRKICRKSADFSRFYRDFSQILDFRKSTGKSAENLQNHPEKSTDPTTDQFYRPNLPVSIDRFFIWESLEELARTCSADQPGHCSNLLEQILRVLRRWKVLT